MIHIMRLKGPPDIMIKTIIFILHSASAFLTGIKVAVQQENGELWIYGVSVEPIGSDHKGNPYTI